MLFFFFERPGLWDVTVTPGGKQCWKSKKSFCIIKRVVRLNNVFNVIILLTIYIAVMVRAHLCKVCRYYTYISVQMLTYKKYQHQ